MYGTLSLLCSVLAKVKEFLTWKIIVAYLKGVSKYRRIAFFFLKYLFHFRDVDVFVLCKLKKWSRHEVYNCNGKIFRTIEAVFFKLDTRNVHHKQNDTCCAVAIVTLLLNTEILRCVLTKDHLLQLSYLCELRKYGNHVCSKQDLPSFLRGW